MTSLPHDGESRQDAPRTNTQKRPELGSWHTLHARATKTRRNGHTFWLRMSYHTPRRAMFIGWRTVFDGKAEWDYEYGEDGSLWAAGWLFTQSNHHEVWLFVVDPRQTPIAVFPFDAIPASAGAGEAGE